MMPSELLGSTEAPGSSRRLLYVVTEDWAFLLHRLPMARAARAAGFDVHVATNVTDGAAAIEREGFVLHPVRFARGRISPAAVFATIRDLRRIHRSVQPVLIHRVAVEPIVIDAVAALGLPGASVNALTGLGYAFIATSMKARDFAPIDRPRVAVSHQSSA